MSEEQHKLASLASLGLSEKLEPEVETGLEELSLRQGHPVAKNREPARIVVPLESRL